MNGSARPGICAIRELLEQWFEHLQDDAKADIRARFRSRDDVQHQSAWFELFWHELMRRGGYDLEIHPTVANVTTNPDFLAQRNGVSRFYLEATLVHQYINNISDYLTRASTHKFINGYIDQLKKSYAQLRVKQAGIRKKVEQEIDPSTSPNRILN